MSLARMEVKRGEWLHSEPLCRNEGSLTSCVHKREEGQRGITSKYMTVMIRCDIRLCEHSHIKQMMKFKARFSCRWICKITFTHETQICLPFLYCSIYTWFCPFPAELLATGRVWGEAVIVFSYIPDRCHQTPTDSFKPVATHTALVKTSGS